MGSRDWTRMAGGFLAFLALALINSPVRLLRAQVAGATMRRFLLTVLLAGSMIGWVKAQEVTSELTATPEQKEILKIEHEKVKAMQMGGSVAGDWFDNIETDTLAQTMPDGRTITKPQHIAEYRTNAFKAILHDHYDYNVRIFNGDTAVVAYLGYDIDVLNGRSSGYTHNVTTDVFVKRDGRWRTVVHHVTRLPQ